MITVVGLAFTAPVDGVLLDAAADPVEGLATMTAADPGQRTSARPPRGLRGLVVEQRLRTMTRDGVTFDAHDSTLLARRTT